MQEGSFRCDANVSIKPKGSETLGTRTEIKNLNSFRFIEKAIDYEVERQADLLDAGKTVVQETRLYDPDADETRSMRSKEEANDYRYFPDPDLAPVVLDEGFLTEIKSAMPELQDRKIARYHDSFGIAEADAVLLVETHELASYFEKASEVAGDAKVTANWMISDLLPTLREHKLTITDSPISADTFAALIKNVRDGVISGKAGKTVFAELWAGETDVAKVIKDKGLVQVSDPNELGGYIDELIAANPAQVQDFQSGNEKIISFFVGQMMKKTGGKANPKLVNQLLREKLAKA